MRLLSQSRPELRGLRRVWFCGHRARAVGQVQGVRRGEGLALAPGPLLADADLEPAAGFERFGLLRFGSLLRGVRSAVFSHGVILTDAQR